MIIRVSSELGLLCVVTKILLAFTLRHVDRDGVLHDVNHLGVGDLAVDLHHGDGIALVVGGVGGDDCWQQEGHERSVGLGVVCSRHQQVVPTEGDHVEGVVTSVDGLKK